MNIKCIIFTLVIFILTINSLLGAEQYRVFYIPIYLETFEEISYDDIRELSFCSFLYEDDDFDELFVNLENCNKKKLE